jgi:hypothetical protein
MAQSDQTVQNATFPTVRADINDNLAALFSQSSGPSAPATTVAWQPWVDTATSPAVWKIRNGTNSGWITIGTLDATTFAAGGLVPIANGGTGQTTASGAINALVPSQTGNANKFLQTNGSVVSWALAAAGASIQIVTATGTYIPSSSKTAFLVLATGGGGGQATAGAGSSGGAGATAIRLYSVSEMGGSASVTIGAAGANGNPGANGGNTVFDPGGTGLTLTGGGGGGGTSAVNGGGAGGTTTNSLFGIDGMPGTDLATPTPSFWNYGPGHGGSYVDAGAAAGIVVVLEF